MPREHHGHRIQYQIRGQHNGRIEPQEHVKIDTPAWLRGVPGFRYGSALEDVYEDGGETEAKGDKVHKENGVGV